MLQRLFPGIIILFKIFLFLKVTGQFCNTGYTCFIQQMVTSSKHFDKELQLEHWIIQRNSSNIESKLPLILNFSALILVKLGLQQLLLNFATSNIELAQIMWEYQISGPQEENEPAKDQERERELLKHILKWF